MPIEEDGNTEPGNLNSGDSTYVTTVHLNSWMLNHSTQEYIAATIIHEAVHAYIRFCQHQVQNNFMDTTTFKTLFPVFWPPSVSYYGSTTNYYNLGASVQHQVMANNLVQVMTDPLKNLYPNSGVPSGRRDSIYTALSWGGLFETPAFFARTDTTFIHASNKVSKETSVHAPFQIFGVTQYYDAHNLQLTKSCN